MFNFKKALKFFKDEWVMLLFKIGMFCIRIGRYKLAISMYQQAIKAKPHFPFIYHYLGDCYLNGKQYEKAISSYKQALDLYANLTELQKNQVKPLAPLNDAEVYRRIGCAYHGLKNYAQSVDYYHKAIEIDVDNPQTYGLIGDAYTELEDYAQAINCFQRAKALNPNDKESFVCIGKCYAMWALKEHPIDFSIESVTYCNRALKLNPYDDRPHKIKDMAHTIFQRNTWVDEFDVIYSKDKKRLIIGNPDITEYKIVDGCEIIDEMAFGDCSGLQQIHIPNSVTEIGFHAFHGCELTEIHCHNPNPPIAKHTDEVVLSDNYCFPNVDKSTCILHIPHNATTTYQNAEIWKDFTNIIEE